MLADLEAVGGMGHGGMGAMMGGNNDGGEMMGMDAFGDVHYPLHLTNGRASSDPITIGARPSGRIWLRIINAGSDTIYRFAIGGHNLTVTHLDGFPITPIEVNTVLLATGERVDAILTVADSVISHDRRPWTGRPVRTTLRRRH